MNGYELKYSKFLADITSQVAEFIKNSYFSGDINKNCVYNEKSEIVDVPTQTVENSDNQLDNVDLNKVEFIEFQQENEFKQLLKNKTLWYILGAVFIYNLLRKKWPNK